MTSLLRPSALVPWAWLGIGLLAGAPAVWLAAGLPLLFIMRRQPAREDEAGTARRQDELALRRQLAIARRRGTPVDLLSAHVKGVTPDELAVALRISDFARLDTPRRGGIDLLVLMDGPSCDRPGMEQRLRGTGGRWSFSWARFPDDGATLDALIDHAVADPRRLELTTTKGRT